jgi:alkylation response protein AidB-like acyl-CoA dehydrogenase
MNFGFSEDQEMIRKSARDFVEGESNLERVRSMREDDLGYSEALWQKIAENGWLGAVYPEEYGGIGLGYVDLICIAEEFGRGLMPEPLGPVVGLGGNSILFGGSEEQKKAILPQVAEGTLKLTLAAYELAGRYNFAHVETSATPSDGGYVLNGTKAFVPNAAASDKIVVSARTSGDASDTEGITLFLVDRDTPGLTITKLSTMDYLPRATVELNDVKVSADAVVGAVGEGHGTVEQSIDRAAVIQCAEQVGGLEESLRRAVAYSQERVQFGKPIGSFQAIKHKAADMFVHLEMSRSSLCFAAMALDQDMPEAKAAVSAAKAMCSEAYLDVTQEAIQIHGGIGFTDECDIHFFYKRARVANLTYGDPKYHRERYAREKGFGSAA